MLPLFLLASADAGVAVVELYTSEGCSSCPPADRVFQALSAEAPPGVILLELHVDYWDRLGWPDPWADTRFSERQMSYGSGAYTPQMIVNGSASFVGSDDARARAEIARALARPTKVDVGIVSVDRKVGHVRVDYALGSVISGSKLVIAVVEDGLSSEVTRGENRGTRLAHDRVVRGWAESAATAHGTIELSVPDTLDPERSRVVVFVETTDHHVHGATERRLGP
jgi:hypothetical protein